MIKAIKIDVVNKTITGIQLPSKDTSKAIYRELDCRCFECVYPSNLDAILYVDEEGLFRDPVLGAFSIKGFPQVISGHAILLSDDGMGSNVDVRERIAAIKPIVRFEDSHYIPAPGFTFTSVD